MSSAGCRFVVRYRGIADQRFPATPAGFKRAARAASREGPRATIDVSCPKASPARYPFAKECRATGDCNRMDYGRKEMSAQRAWEARYGIDGLRRKIKRSR